VTAKQARLELERANTWLRQAVENALEMKAAASEIPTSLERIAHSLNSVAAASIEGETQSLKPELEVLRSRMGQLQMLLDGAAAFYCASIARSRAADALSYAAHGGRAPAPVVHQLQLNA
jgi:hypothetical protein